MALNYSAFQTKKKTSVATGGLDFSAFGGVKKTLNATPPLSPAAVAPLAQNSPISPILPVGEGRGAIQQERAKIGQDLTKSITDFINTTILPKIAPETGNKPVAPVSSVPTTGKLKMPEITGKLDVSAFDKLGEDFESMPAARKARELGIQIKETTTPLVDRGLNFMKDFANAKPLKEYLNRPEMTENIKVFAEATKNLPLKTYASLVAIGSGQFKQRYKIYDELLKTANDPNNPAWKQFLNAFQNTVPQTMIGVLLGVATAAVTKNPKLVQGVTGLYYGALSADEQIREKGKIESIGNILIDTAGDQLLGQYIGGLLSKPATLLKSSFTTLLRKYGEGATIEGGTEVMQTLLKNANDYRNVTTDEEKKRIIEKTKEYVKSGDILMEFLVAGASGGIVTGAGAAGGGSLQGKEYEDQRKKLLDMLRDESGYFRIPIGMSIKDVSGGIPKDLQPLATEAKKYKSAEEFVKAQGTPVFHGTSEKFDTFGNDMKGSITGAQSAKGAIWFTEDSATAKAYSVYAAETGPINKLMAQHDVLEKVAQKSGKQSDWAKVDKLTQEIDDLGGYDATYQRRLDNANVKDAVIKGDFLTVDAKGKSPQELSKDGNIDSWLQTQLDKGRAMGKDGVKFVNLDDAVGLYNQPATHYAIFDAKNIKTKSQLTNFYNQVTKKTPSEMEGVDQPLEKPTTSFKRGSFVSISDPRIASELETLVDTQLQPLSMSNISANEAPALTRMIPENERKYLNPEKFFSDIIPLYQNAKKNASAYQKILIEAGVTKVQIGVKDRLSVAKKVIKKRMEIIAGRSKRISYNVTDINDLLRATTIAPTEADALALVKKLGDLVVKYDDYFANPKDGYQGINVDLKMPDGSLAELQIHTQESLANAIRIWGTYKGLIPEEAPKLLKEPVLEVEDIQNLLDTIEIEGGMIAKEGLAAAKNLISQEQFNNMRDLVDSMRSAIEEHPAAPLMKYMNRQTGELPEILGLTKQEFLAKYGKTRELTARSSENVWEFIKRGDDIVQNELSFEDSAAARKSFGDLQNLQKRFGELKTELTEMRTGIAEAKKQGMELKRIQNEITKAIRNQTFSLRKYLQGIKRGKARGVRVGKVIGRKELREQLAVKLANKQGNIEEVKREITELAMQELDLNERGKLLATVKNATTFEDLAQAKEYIKELQTKAEDRELRDKIRNELADIKPRKDKSGIMRGKFDAESQATLEQLRKILDMDRSVATAKINDNLEKYGEMSLIPDSVALENELLQYADLSELKGAQLDELYEIVLDIKNTGRTKRQVQVENEKAKIEAKQMDFENVLTGGYGLKPGTGIVPVESANELRNGFLDFIAKYDDAHMGGDFLFDKLSKYHKDSGTLQSPLNKWWRQVHEARNAENASIRKATEYIQKKVADIFRLEVKSKEFRDKMIKYMQEKREVGTFRTGNGEMVHIKESVNQLLEWWMQFQDETLIPTYQETMHWTDSMMREVEKSLTPQEIEIGKKIMKFYNEFRSGAVDDVPLDPIYEKMTGVKLGKVENYSPIRRDAELPNYIQIGQDAMRHASGKPGAIKARTANAKPIKTVGAFTMLQRHITEMSHYKAFVEFIGEARRVFMGTVNEAVRQYHGSSTLNIINNLVDDLARGGLERGKTVEWLDTARGNFAVAVTGANPVVFMKQLSSIPAYLSEMPAGAWFGGVAEFWGSPVENTRFLFENSEYMKSRYDLGSFERDIKAAMKRNDNKGLANTKNMKEWFTVLIRAGDKVAVAQGGWPVYKYNYDRLIREGQSPAAARKEAIRIFEEATKRTQQAGGIEDLGSIQRSGSWGNLFTLFMTSPIQYYRHISAASRALFGARLPKGASVPPGGSWRIHRGPAGDALKRLFIYWVVLPMIFQWISDGFAVRPRRLGRAALLGGFTYPVILGEFATDIGNALFGLPIFSGGGTPAPLTTLTQLARDVQSNVKKFSDGISGEDIWSAVLDLASVAGKAFGVPVDPIVRTATGVYDVATGESADPRRLIYSQYMLGDQGAEKEPKKATGGRGKRGAKKPAGGGKRGTKKPRGKRGRG